MRDLCLTKTENATECLLLDGVVPPWVDGDNAIGAGEVESYSTAFEDCDHDFDPLFVVEAEDGFFALFLGHVAGVVDVVQSLALQHKSDDSGHGSELSEN